MQPVRRPTKLRQAFRHVSFNETVFLYRTERSHHRTRHPSERIPGRGRYGASRARRPFPPSEKTSAWLRARRGSEFSCVCDSVLSCRLSGETGLPFPPGRNVWVLVQAAYVFPQSCRGAFPPKKSVRRSRRFPLCACKALFTSRPPKAHVRLTSAFLLPAARKRASGVRDACSPCLSLFGGFLMYSVLFALCLPAVST